MIRRVEAFRDALYELFRSGEDPEDVKAGLGADALLDGMDFFSLLQALLHKAEKVYEYRTDSSRPTKFDYRGRELFDTTATKLYEDKAEMVFDAADYTLCYELWYLPDNSFAVTTCFRVNIAENAYITEYRVHKGTDWSETGIFINFPELAARLEAMCGPVMEHVFPLYDL